MNKVAVLAASFACLSSSLVDIRELKGEMRASIAEVNGSIAKLESSIDSLKTAVDRIGTKVDELDKWRHKFLGGAVLAGATATVITLVVLLITKFSGYITIQAP